MHHYASRKLHLLNRAMGGRLSQQTQGARGMDSTPPRRMELGLAERLGPGAQLVSDSEHAADGRLVSGEHGRDARRHRS